MKRQSRTALIGGLVVATLIGTLLPPMTPPSFANPSPIRLAPVIKQQQSSVGDGKPTDYVFWDQTPEFDFTGGSARIGANSDASGSVAIDDQATISVIRADGSTCNKSIDSYTKNKPPIDISDCLAAGNHYKLRFQLHDRIGPVYGNPQEIWLAFSSLPPSNDPCRGGISPSPSVPLAHFDVTFFGVSAFVSIGQDVDWSIGVSKCRDYSYSFSATDRTFSLQSDHGAGISVDKKGKVTTSLQTTVDGWVPNIGVNSTGDFYTHADTKTGIETDSISFHNDTDFTQTYKLRKQRGIDINVAVDMGAVIIATILVDLYPGLRFSTFFAPTLKDWRQKNLQQTQASTKPLDARFSPQVPDDVTQSPVPEVVRPQQSVSADVQAAVATRFAPLNQWMTLAPLSTSRSTVSAYTPFTVQASGFTPKGKVLVTVGPTTGADVLQSVVVADSSGAIKTDLAMPTPDQLPTLGTYVVTAFDQSSLHSSLDQLVNGSVDSIKLYTAAQTIQVVQDVTPPKMSAVVTGTMGLNNWYISFPTVTVSGVDDLSGFNNPYIQVDQGAFVVTNTVTLKDGVHVVTYTGDDKVGNRAANQQLTVKVDTVPPSLSGSIAGSRTRDATGVFFGPGTLNFTVTDATSGVASLSCSTDNGTTWQTIPLDKPSLTITTSGTFHVLCKASDAAGLMTTKDFGTITIHNLILHSIGITQSLSIADNVGLNVTGGSQSNGSVRIIDNGSTVITGTISTSATSGNQVSGNLSTAKIPQLLTGTPVVPAPQFSLDTFKAIADVITAKTLIIDTTNASLQGVFVTLGDAIITATGGRSQVTIAAQGKVTDQSTQQFTVQAADLTTGMLYYGEGGVTVGDTSSTYKGCMVSPNGKVSLADAVSMSLKGCVIGKAVDVVDMGQTTITFDPIIASQTLSLPLSAPGTPSGIGTRTAITATPTLYTPSKGRGTKPTTGFSWSTVANAKAYELEVSKTANSFNDKDLVVSIATVSTSYGVVLPSGPSTIYIRVRGINAGTPGPWSTVLAYPVPR